MKKRYLGFTLIELLVAMAIIAVLATVGLGAFFTAQMKGRDARRKADLEQIQRALEIYFNDKGVYPEAAEIDWGPGHDLVDPDGSGELYIKVIPSDPQSPGVTYFYEVDTPDRTWYNLYAILENDNDVCFTANPVACVHPEHLGTAGACGSENCRYKVSSPNAP